MSVLVVDADDFGHSAGVNAGIVEAHERGIVTSASLMVRRPEAAAAAAYARAHPELSVGLHAELGEWAYRGADGWVAVDEVEDGAVPAEIERQLELFRALLGRDPTHLDSHQHVHLREPARSALVALGRRLGVPVRHLTGDVRYCGDFYGKTDTGEPLPARISAEALIGVLRSLPEGTTELLCHPGKGVISGTSYAQERVRELEALCHPAARAAVREAGIELRSFGELR